MKKRSKSFEIALSAIAAAFAAGFLMLGTLNPFLLATGYLVATFALMVPLSKDFVWGSVLAYLAAGLIALPLGLWKIIPYAVFFGLHPIVNYLQKKYVKRTPLKVLCLIAKAIWFDFAMWLSFYVLTSTSMAGMEFPPEIAQFIYYIIFLGGTVFFVVYDVMIFFCQRSADLAIRRIRR